MGRSSRGRGTGRRSSAARAWRRSLLTVVLVSFVAGCVGADGDDVEVAGVVVESDAGGADRLPAGPSEAGAFLGFGDDGVELAGVGPLEADPGPGVTVDVQRSPDDGRADCRATVRAGGDRPLEARGSLAVELVLSGRDGAERRISGDPVELDVRLQAGDTREVPIPLSADIVPDTLVEVRCEAVFEPRT